MWLLVRFLPTIINHKAAAEKADEFETRDGKKSIDVVALVGWWKRREQV